MVLGQFHERLVHLGVEGVEPFVGVVLDVCELRLYSVEFALHAGFLELCSGALGASVAELLLEGEYFLFYKYM